MRTPFFLTAVLALSAISLVGCKKERYYCDETGCYLCDGIGCRAVDPPPRPPCDGDFECTVDTLCTSAGCTDKCNNDADCPRGTVCDPATKLCLNPTEPPPTPNPGVCSRNEQCDPPDVICVNGLCQRDDECPQSGCACSAANPCTDGFTCTDGSCRPDDEACHFDAECGAGRTCVDGACFQDCTSASCGAGFMCDANKVCVPTPPPVGQCTNTAGCDVNHVCIDSSCIPTCTTNANCASGYYCDNGVCRVDDLPHPFCTTNAQCAGDSQCVNGVCRAPCTNSMQCAQISGSLPFCHQNFCSTFNEANSNCTTSIDCGANDVCIDGVCQ